MRRRSDLFPGTITIHTLLFAGALLLCACGSDGAKGPAGADGAPGKAGSDGEPGDKGDRGSAGEPGKAGTPGTSCTVTDEGEGTRTVSCTDGTQVTINDGAQGTPGTPGTPGKDGNDGKPGDAGAPGANGTSCSVDDNLDGTKTISCTDGTNVIVRDGAPGAASFSLRAEMPKQLTISITAVTIASPPVLNFFVTDTAGRGATGLVVDGTSASNLRFTLAKLVPAAAGSGDPDRWQSYINRATSGHTMATYERNGTLVDRGDGRYTYTFATDPATSTDPVSSALIVYDATLTHRVGIQASGSLNSRALPAVNATFDFRPAGGPVTRTRDVVATTSCNECHGTLKAHGGRVDTKYCVTCHNPGLSDSTGLTGNFGPLVHSIHSASYRKAQEVELSKAPGTFDYVFEGQNFAEVTYPQALNNCLKCHDGTIPSTPQGNNWRAVPTKEACSGCHVEVDFSAPYSQSKHLGGPMPNNTTCATPNCHAAEQIEAQHATEDATPNTPQVITDLQGNPAINFSYAIKEVTVNGSNQPVVVFRILKDGAPMTLAASYPDLTGGPSFLVAYASADQDGVTAPVDYNNKGKKAAQPASVAIANLVNGTQGSLSAPDLEGYYTATLTGSANAAAFPVGATLRAVALQGYFSQKDFFGVGLHLARHAISVEKPVTGDPARREIVDNAKCSNCHEWFLGHGGNRVYSTDVCVMCHVPNLTSSGRGLNLTTHPNAWGVNEHPTTGFDAAAPLSWPEESMSFKTLIHSTHASAVRSAPFTFVRDRCSGSGGTSCVYYYDLSEVTFPGVLNNCETCHKPGTYSTNLPDGVFMTTDVTTTGNDTSSANVQTARSSVPNATDLATTPVAAACVGCHDSQIAKSHMEGHGAFVQASRSTTSDYVETCSLCHGPGRLADVALMHAP